MKKTPAYTDLTKNTPLIERQRKLWAISDEIEIASLRGQPLSKELTKFITQALKKIAMGEDANSVLDVVPEKRGVKKNSFKNEFEKNLALSYVSAVKNSTSKSTNKKAISDICEKLPSLEEATVRKLWNSSSANRKPGFTPSIPPRKK